MGATGAAGLNGQDGQHGMGQYFRYKLVTDGQTPTEPYEVSIGSNGVLATVSGWTKEIPSPVTGQSLWVLLGRGKAGETITWSGVYKAGQKGERGDPAVGALGDGAVTKSKLASDVLTVARADAYGIVDNNTFLSAENGQANTTGKHNTAIGSGALRLNTTGQKNTASGTGALRLNTTGDNNTASGTGALSLNTTGDNNTASGTGALSLNTTGHRNTASGTGALQLNTTGNYNTASGHHALQLNTTGQKNTASGSDALRLNTTGSFNTASGSDALILNTTGDNNTASGYYALKSNTEGGNNTASGAVALYRNTEGDYNTASGVEALRANTTGSNNVAVGYNAGYNLRTGSNCIFIGYNTTAPLVDSSDKLSIGNTIRGDLSKGNMVIDGKMTQKSDERLKENVEAVADGLGCVKLLRPITFTRKEVPEAVFEKDLDGNDIIPNPAPEGGQRGSSEKEYGLIAQEVEKVCPEIVETSEYAEGYKSVEYSRLSILLLKAVQQQQEQIETLKGENQTLKKRIVALEAQ